MKKFTLLTVLLSVVMLNTLYAQYCGGSGTSVCTALPPSAFTEPGFKPGYDSLPCVTMGVPYDQTISFLAPGTVTQGNSTYNLNWVRVDTLRNLPCGLCWKMGNANNQISADSTGCIRISGTSFDAPGQYRVKLKVSANVQIGIFPFTVSNQDGDSLGIKYFSRVITPGATTCPAVDTLAVGLQAHSSGSLSTPTITGPSSVCSGSNATLSASVSGGYTYVWSNGTVGSSITVGTAGTYTVTAYGNCASATATKTISVTTPSSTITAGGPTTFCQGGSVTLNAGAGFSNYAWSNGANTQQISVTQAGNYTVTVTQSGCTATSTNTIPVTVNSATASITPSGPLTFCQGGSVTLDAGAGSTVYNWSNSASTQSINVTQAGTYTVTVTQNGCTATDSKTVTVNNTTVSITPGGATTFCQGGSVTLDAGAGYSSYNWSNGATTQTTSVTAGNTYTVTVSQNNCTASDNEVVTVNNNTVSIAANGPLTFCQGGSVTLDAGAGYSSYIWSNGSTSQSITVNTDNTYSVTVLQNNCSATDSKVVTVVTNNLSPNITASGPLNICPGGSVTLDAGAGYDTYTWSTSSANQTITVNSANTYTVTVTQGACSGSNSVTVNVGNFPVAINTTPAGPISACVGDNVTLDAGSGFDTYAWSNSTGNQTTTVTTSGAYVISVTKDFCSGTDTVDVTFNAIPAVSITPGGTQTICQGGSLVLDAGNGFDTYAWSTNDNTQTSTVSQAGSYSVTVTDNGCTATDNVSVSVLTGISVTITPGDSINICPGGFISIDAGAGYDTYLWNTTDNTQDIVVSTAGTYYVTVTQGVCTATDSIKISVSPVPLVVNITPAGPVQACAGDQITLDAGGGYTAYNWSNSDQSQTTTVTTGGNYVVTAVANGCVGRDTVVVTVNSIPTPNLLPSGTQTICQGQTLNIITDQTYDTYNWSTGATTAATQVTTTSTVDVTVTKNGCTGSSANSTNITVNAVPNAVVTELSSANGQAVLQATPAGAVYTWLYQASPTGGYTVTSNTTQNDTVVCGDVADFYTAIVTLNGCADTSNTVTVACVGIDETGTNVMDVNIRPNPVKDLLTMSFELVTGTAADVYITDVSGRKVVTVTNSYFAIGKHTQNINVSELAQGVYILNFITANGRFNARFVKD